MLTDLNDTIYENANEGSDFVTLSVTNAGVYTLGLNVESLLLYSNNVEAHGTSADNIIASFGTGNSLWGEGGNDQLQGSANAEVMHAGWGNDRITGGGGNDQMWGEFGVDTFVFATGSGADEIVDFIHNEDKIDLSGWGISSFSQVQGMMSQQGNNTFLNLGAGNSITLDNVMGSTLTASDFLLATPGTPHDAVVPAASLLMSVDGQTLPVGTAPADDVQSLPTDEVHAVTRDMLLPGFLSASSAVVHFDMTL